MLERDLDTEVSDYFRGNVFAVREGQDLRKFASLQTDEERVSFILGIPEAHLLPLEFPGVGIRNGERALKLKENGNKAFGRGDFPKALEYYSDAMIVAPENEMGIISANRSAVLYRLELFDMALSDIEESVRIGYPKELLYKLEERRARCLLAVKKHAAAVDAFRSTLQQLDHAKLPIEKKQKIEYDARMMLAVMDRGKKLNGVVALSDASDENRSDNVLPKVAGQRNSTYPSFSNAIDVVDAGGSRGRYSIATREIIPGEVLAVEKPHAAVLLAEFRLKHCHLCFARVVAPFPAACNSCSAVVYCTTKCRDRDSEMHMTECPLLIALWVSSASVTCILALRAITQIPVNELLKMKDSVKGPSIENKIHKPTDYKSFYRLVTHEEERTPEDLFHRAYMASWLLRVLKRSNYFPADVNTPDSADVQLSSEEMFVGGLLLHNLQVLQFNAHEISELVCRKGEQTLEKAKSIFIGGGIYPSVALLNHSCNPSVIRYFLGTTMVVRALRTIRPGEEVSENYGPIFTIMPENERKRKLRVQYWFDCTCEACTGHWPLLESIDPRILRFRCESGAACGNILPVSTDSNEFMITCPKCKNNMNILKGLKVIQDTDAMFKIAARQLENGQHEMALKGYFKILKLLDENLAPPLRDYHLCQQGVRLCVLGIGNKSYV